MNQAVRLPRSDSASSDWGRGAPNLEPTSVPLGLVFFLLQHSTTSFRLPDDIKVLVFVLS